MAKRAQELDPLAHRIDLATTLLRAGRYRGSVPRRSVRLEFEPAYPRPHPCWAGPSCSGRDARAIAAARAGGALAPGDSLHSASSARPTGWRARRHEAREALARSWRSWRSVDTSRRTTWRMCTRGWVSTTGDRLLERAFDDRAGGIYGIKGSYLFAPLRGIRDSRRC